MTEQQLAKILGGKLYLVGGAVRDLLAGRKPADRDYVLCGVDVQDVPLDRVVGDFPVFLTEVDGDVCEIALARTEKKTGRGYRGFTVYSDPSVTIEMDLYRRDLTINAMAIDVSSGEFIDPFGGDADLKAGILRHVSDAFAEDPLRVYRVARFAARFGYRIAPETLSLMRRLRNELTDLTPERVWLEMRKALLTHYPDLFFRTLKDAGVLGVHFPEIDALDISDKHDGTAFEHTMSCLYRGHGLYERFGLLVHDLGKGLSDNPPAHHGHDKHEHLIEEMGNRIRIPRKIINFGRTTMRLHMRLKKLQEMRDGKLFRIVNPDIFRQLKLSYLESMGRFSKADYLASVRLIKKVIRIQRQVTGKALIERGIKPDALFGMKLLQERIKAYRMED